MSQSRVLLLGVLLLIGAIAFNYFRPAPNTVEVQHQAFANRQANIDGKLRFVQHSQTRLCFAYMGEYTGMSDLINVPCNDEVIRLSHVYLP